ncbi:prolyl 4-hydroxylase subunit alpha-1 isoform X3 [Nematostella vectensis]|nr:prolyl 4-hydroxylase subunit alpha-1 isoform X3 [Nematostella vectensis]
MLRLQKVYNISSQSISSGVIPGQRNAHARLSGIDSYQIGRKAYEDGNIIQAKAWMENTLRMMGTSESLQNLTGHVVVSRNDVLNHLAFLEYKIGDLARSLRFYREMLVNDPNDTELQSNIRKLKHLIAKQPHLNVTSPPNTANRIEDDGDDELSREEMAEYTRLCRPNSQTRLPSSNKQLTCSYLNKHPGLKLKPVAMEIVSVNPQITLFHNVLSEMEIEQMLKLARPRLRRARVNNLETGEIEDVDYRISQIAWLSDSDGDIVRRINRRVGFITGLNTNTGECLQVNNYGVGGHYEPHFDHSLDMENSPIASLGQGNRIATFMFYLSEVEAGGSTVFIKTGVKTNPFKGGAVFWYNLKKSGEGDWDSLHAGCPVLIGNKWVANKWLHEHGNEFTRQCGLTEDED